MRARFAILHGLGLKKEGYRPKFRLMRGERHDEVLYEAVIQDLDQGTIRKWASEFGIRSDVT